MNTLLVITLTGILLMISEIFRIRKLVFPVAVTGLLCSLGFNLAAWNTNLRYYSDMMFFDNYAVCFSAVMIISTILWFLLSRNYP
jgi:NADH-quinone oxidoreductase subunit N